MEIKDVENLAELAKIELSENEKKELLKDMEVILKYVKQIEEVEVEDIPVSYEHINIWREDVADTEKAFTLALIQKQFPDSQNGFIKVKKILS